MDEINTQNDNNYKSCFLLDSIAGMFYFTFSFSKSIVEWNEFSGEAWYEHQNGKNEMSQCKHAFAEAYHILKAGTSAV